MRLRIRRGELELDVVALVNSGYEADSPQLMVPVGLARRPRRLGLWPPPSTAYERIFDTAGGPLRVWVLRKAAVVKVVASDAESREVEVDLIVSPLADEPLISDVLADELEIALESPGRGLWRFRWEPSTKTRLSEVR